MANRTNILVDGNLNKVPKPYRDAEGTRYPDSIAQGFSDDELRALGWYVVYNPGIPDGMMETSRKLVWNGVPQQSQVWIEYTLRDIAPTPEEQEAEKDAIIAAADEGQMRIFLRVTFNHENRIRALEGKAPITMTQFKQQLRSLL